jgi:N-acyl-D-amino-acid deacylase
VGIRGDRIAAISTNDLRGRQVLDARNKVVSPGFVDIHVHEDEAFRMLHDQSITSQSIACTGSALVRTGVSTLVGGNCGYSPYPLEEQFSANFRVVCNYASLVGYNSLRDRFWSGNGDLGQILEHLQGELDAGAFGLSFGLQYNTAIARDELLATARVLRDRGRFIAAHLRYDYPSKAVDSASEILDVAEETGVSAHISHIAANIYGGDNLAKILERMQQLRRRGFDVSADTYPYGVWGTGITSDVFSDGWEERYAFSYGDIEIVSGPYSGQRCTAELFDELRAAPGDTFVVCHNATPPEDVDAALRSRLVFVACDGSLHCDDQTGEIKGHPRSAGTAPRVLGRMVRERGLLTLTEALSKLSLEPARRMGLGRKGRLREGMDADITVFDPETIMDRSTFGAGVCATPPDGIACVVIGGSVAYADGDLETGKGRVLRAS